MEQGPPDVDVETHEIAGAMGKSFSGVFEYAHMCRHSFFFIIGNV